MTASIQQKCIFSFFKESIKAPAHNKYTTGQFQHLCSYFLCLLSTLNFSILFLRVISTFRDDFDMISITSIFGFCNISNFNHKMILDINCINFFKANHLADIEG